MPKVTLTHSFRCDGKTYPAKKAVDLSGEALKIAKANNLIVDAAEAEAKAKEEAETKAKAEVEAKAKEEAETKAKAEVEAKANKSKGNAPKNK